MQTNTSPQCRIDNLTYFKDVVWTYYNQHKRSFPWRDESDPYKIVVSEIMLQQTQTCRVMPKYEQFIDVFPGFAELAHASLHSVLVVWQGLGYNRRALALHKIAQRVMNEYAGWLPACHETLQTFPGIGWATAGSICAFAFNQPTIFIETNIRTVYIHFFANNQHNIKDKELLPLVEATLDHDNPRHWYYALMDYGVMLKSTIANPSRKSAHHVRQSRFEGSDRQIRGIILKLITERESMPKDALFSCIDRPQDRIAKALQELIKENLVRITGNSVHIC
jgi:A/G-specific adenine glycosylase